MNVHSFGSSTLPPVYLLRGRSVGRDSSPDTAATRDSANCDAGGVCAASPALAHGAQRFDGFQRVDRAGVAPGVANPLAHPIAYDKRRNGQPRDTTWLRFHYDLTTADGQHVELNVKAKVRQVSIQDAAGNSASKTQVKLRFSLLQQEVADGLSPLQSDQAPSGTPSGVADGLQAFLNSVTDALQNFVEGNSGTGDTITADDLVTRTVDTFNALVDALTHLFFQPAEGPAGNDASPALPASGDSVAQIPAIAAPLEDNADLGPVQPAAESPPAPLPAEGGVTNESSIPGTSAVASSDNPVADVASIPAAAVPADQLPVDQLPADPVPADPISADEGAPVVPSAPTRGQRCCWGGFWLAVSHAQLVTQVLQTVRFRFVQSLTQIIHTLTPAGQTDDNATASSQLLVYHSSLSLKIHTASLVDLNA